MDVLQAEIARKRKSINQICGDGKRYFKRSTLEEFEREKYLERWKDQLDAKSILSKNKLIGHSQQKQCNNEDDIDYKNERNDHCVTFSVEEIKRMLRLRNQPIKLFGESDIETFERLREIDLCEPQWKGQRNDFKAAMDQVDKKYLNELLNDDHGSNDNCGDSTDVESTITNKIHVSYPEPSMTYEELAVIMAGRKHPGILESSTLISTCFKIILKRWADYLNSRPDDQCRIVSGRIETVLFQQTLSYLNPLFRKLKNNTLASDIMDSLLDVVQSMFQRNYRRANEYFLELAIGNAPWPIGATNVGIHPRPGREKIASKHVAHVLNDETQRKYLQAVKRIITKAQLFYPGEPALSVEYQTEIDDS
ncbi:hypothetical protein GJ496_008856 [Pomphorhynchus laevis]|nr:hypothetical protein GJ496_008856 [Pomphorhynchus laevis]